MEIEAVLCTNVPVLVEIIGGIVHCSYTSFVIGGVDKTPGSKMKEV